MRLLFKMLLGLHLFSFCMGHVFAMTEAEMRNAIQNRVAERHPKEDPNFWKQMGEPVVPILKDLLSKTESLREKTFYIEGLSYFSNPELSKEFDALLDEHKENAVLRKKIVVGYVMSQGEAAFERVKPFLEDTSDHVREALYQALGKIRLSEEHQEILQNAMGRERVDWIQKKVAALKKPSTKEEVRTFQGTWISSEGKSSARKRNLRMKIAKEITSTQSIEWILPSGKTQKEDGVRVRLEKTELKEWIIVIHEKKNWVFVAHSEKNSQNQKHEDQRVR